MKSALVWSCLAGLAQSNFDCGNLFACTTPDGSFVECQNPARRGCCKGLPYWLYNTTDGITTLQACCEDTKGNPFIGLGGCPTTAPTTAAPTPSPTIGCGNLFACTEPNGTFVECQNPARRGCCKGLPYWLYNTTDGITMLQACCEDAKGNPFIGLGGCPTTTPTTIKPTPAPTPATTPVCGNSFACTTPDGTLVECLNLARRGCCKGIPYWYYPPGGDNTIYQSCCEDPKGNPVIVQGGCPTTPSTTIKPTPATTPAPTPASSPATTPTPTSVCGNLVPCTLPNGTLVECQNPNHRKCCKGLPYWVYVTSGGSPIYQSCCEDSKGNPFIVQGPSCPSHSSC